MARLLLDTHIVLAVSARERFVKHFDLGSIFSTHETLVSVASLWEIAIKQRIGKLRPAISAEQLPRFLDEAAIALLDITRLHAVASVDPEPATRDPFDRMLLAQCQVEGLQLVTFDEALVSHPLAFRKSV